MVVRGWYMTHFDRRDLLQSKKQVWGGFRNLSGLPSPIRDFFRFFREISTEAHKPKNPSAPTFESENYFQKLFFDNQISFPWIYDMPAPFWYIHIFRTPSRSISLSFWNKNVNFFLLMCITLFWNPLYFSFESALRVTLQILYFRFWDLEFAKLKNLMS